MEPLDYITITPQETAKLLSAGNGDAALLLLYIRATGDIRLVHAQQELHMSTQALGWAESLLKQLGLLEVKPQTERYSSEKAPSYSGETVASYGAKDPSFVLLQGEVSRRLGRVLTTEELKTLLAIRDYLKLPPEVVSMVITYCLQRNEYHNRVHGSNRKVTLRTIERECYAWANQGIVTLELASDYIGRSLSSLAPETQIKKILQLDRPLVDSERAYIKTWLDWGMEPDVIRMAYEKTILATNKLAWRYMHRILESWHEKGLHTLAEVQNGDQKTAPSNAQEEGFALGERELKAIEAMAKRRNQQKEG